MASETEGFVIIGIHGLGKKPPEANYARNWEAAIRDGLAHNLGLLAVAEGVEEEEQARLLRQLACDAAQGFLFAPALAGAEVAAWATSQATAAAAA